MKPFYKSKKWWSAMIAVAIPVLNHFLGWGMDMEQVALIVLPLIGYVFGEAWTDATH